MKLITDKGELTLPANFSFEVEQNSAFFSEEGAASIAATIPATPKDQSSSDSPADWPGRIDMLIHFLLLFRRVFSRRRRTGGSCCHR